MAESAPNRAPAWVRVADESRRAGCGDSRVNRSALSIASEETVTEPRRARTWANFSPHCSVDGFYPTPFEQIETEQPP